MQKTLNFTKMHGLGNDFVIVEGKDADLSGKTYSELAIEMCDRHFGIGADGLIIVNPPDVETDADISWRIFNADGTEPEMCGNGIRCFARYVYEKGHISKKKFTVQTLAGIIIPEILENKEVKVDMGNPRLDASEIPFTGIKSGLVKGFKLEVSDREFEITTVNMGNPHCVIFSNDDTAVLARKYGHEISTHNLFPKKTNVEFVKVISKNHIKVDVWERGCGITLACGTGACASAVASIINNLAESPVQADLPGGSLKIEWDKNSSNSSVFMTGKSEFVFEGKYLLTK